MTTSHGKTCLIRAIKHLESQMRKGMSSDFQVDPNLVQAIQTLRTLEISLEADWHWCLTDWELVVAEWHSANRE
jgi:hypothetical protein